MEEEPLMEETEETEPGELVPYAHRDIKPGTSVMETDIR
jgi:hypothetical protein